MGLASSVFTCCPDVPTLSAPPWKKQVKEVVFISNYSSVSPKYIKKEGKWSLLL